MIWIILILLISGSAALLWASGVRGPLLQISGAGLLFAAAGYAVQGSAGLEGAPQAGSQRAAPIPLTTLRHAFFGRFSGTEHWMLIAESYARRGQTADAVGVLRSAVREHPGSLPLWIGLGNALVDHASGLTPAAQLSYQRALGLAPVHPAPKFFYGLALARSGDRSGALALWNSALADAPAEADWRPYVEDAVAALQAPPQP